MRKTGLAILAASLLAGCASRAAPDLDVRVGGVPLDVELHVASLARYPLPYGKWRATCQTYMAKRGHRLVELEGIGLYLQGAGPIAAASLMLLNHVLREGATEQAELGGEDAVR